MSVRKRLFGDGWIPRSLAVLIEPEVRIRWIGVVLLAVVAAVLESVGALIIFFSMNQIVEGGGETPIDRLLPTVSTDETLAVVAVLIGAFFVFRGVFTVARAWYAAKTVQTTTARTSDRLFHRYLASAYRTHLMRSSPELIRNAITSVEGVSTRFLSPLVVIASEAIVIVTMTVVLAVMAPVATLVVAIVLAGAGLVLLSLVHKRIRAVGHTSEVTARRSLAVLQQSLHDLRGIKVFGREMFFAGVFRDERNAHARARYEMATLSEIPRVGMETLVFLLIVAFLAVSTVDVAKSSIAVLGLFAYTALRIMPGVSRVISNLNRVRFSSAAVTNVVNDLQGPEPVFSRRRHGEAPLDWSVLAFTGVGFRYDAAGPEVVHGIDLTIRRGERLGVVGPTGSGKSTFLDLFLGILEPGTGSIAIDGVRLGDVLDSWHDSIGFVAQDVFLLDDSIRRNVAFGIPDVEIDDGRVWAALVMAQLAGFVEASDRGLDTKVGERGVALSGGERQRIAIARALYDDPGVLVFDEATSSLDTATEKDLLAAIANLPEAKTVLTVAHRLSTVRSCDRIIVFSEGGVVGSGTYDDLAQGSEVFRELVWAAE